MAFWPSCGTMVPAASTASRTCCARAPDAVVTLDCFLRRHARDELLGQDHRIDEGTIGTLPEVGCHRVSRVADQDQAAGEPASAVNPAHRVDQQVIEGGDLRQQTRRGRESPVPDVEKCWQVPTSHSIGRWRRLSSHPEVGKAMAQRRMAEGPQACPVLL